MELLEIKNLAMDFGKGADAARAYSGGSWLEILAFRTEETHRVILPLLALTFPRIFAMMRLYRAWPGGSGVCSGFIR